MLIEPYCTYCAGFILPAQVLFHWRNVRTMVHVMTVYLHAHKPSFFPLRSRCVSHPPFGSHRCVIYTAEFCRAFAPNANLEGIAADQLRYEIQRTNSLRR